MKDYLPDRDRDLQAWFVNFLSVANANLTTLGLTAADLASLTADSTGMGTSLTASTALKMELEAEVGQKNQFRAAATGDARSLVKRIQINPNVSYNLKLKLGINPGGSTRTFTPPVQPAALLATPQADGTNVLKWDKMGNKPTTQFAVFAKPLTDSMSVYDNSGWTIVGQTTKSNYQHKNVTPGVPMAYKVMALRAGFASDPSIPATVYTG